MPVLLAFLVLLTVLPPARAADLIGQVRVLDGGSLQMGDTVIRLWGIAPPPPGTWQGARAREVLADTIAGEAILCRPVEPAAARREVAVCRTFDDVDLSSYLVFSGLALDRTGRYAAQMEAARAGGRGIWAGRTEDRDQGSGIRTDRPGTFLIPDP